MRASKTSLSSEAILKEHKGPVFKFFTRNFQDYIDLFEKICIEYLRIRLIWGVEKAASSIPQRTARRASRFLSLRLLLASESCSPAVSWRCDGAGSFGNLRPYDRKWRLLWRDGGLVNERRWEMALVEKSEGEEREWWSVGVEMQWYCNLGHCLRGRISWWAILLLSSPLPTPPQLIKPKSAHA